MAESRTHPEWDVIVVGAGGAGLAAAAEAAACGCRVLSLDKRAEPGGSTSWTVGALAAANTRLQQQAGIEDSAQWHFEDLGAHNGALDARDNLCLRRLLVDRCTEALEWLVSLGVVFLGPVPDPPHRAARLHYVVPHARAVIARLLRHCVRLGVEMRSDARVVGLIVENARVTGVECALQRGKRRFNARRGVVLATGDYSGDRELKAHLGRPDVAEVEPLVASNTGDGHKLALALGAQVVNGDLVRGPVLRFVPPKKAGWRMYMPNAPMRARALAWSHRNLSQRLLRRFMMRFVTAALGPSRTLFERGAILVNVEGRRFCDELDRPEYEVLKQPYKIAFILFDRDIAQRFQAGSSFIATVPGVSHAYLADYRRHRRDIVRKAASLERLAESLGMPSQTLQRTVAHYNAAPGPGRPALLHSPYYALGPVKSYCEHADGGLQVSERMEVLDRAGSPIAGLFAAGSTGQGGLLLEGNGHRFAWAFVSGRMAGRSVAAAVAEEAVHA